MFRPFRVVPVQFRLDPVLVSDDRLFAVVAYDQGRDSSEDPERPVVDLDPLRLFCGDHPLRVDKL